MGTFAGAEAAPGAVITGVTGWTDWVALRSLFAAARKRVRDERRLAHTGIRSATPFAWTMV